MIQPFIFEMEGFFYRFYCHIFLLLQTSKPSLKPCLIYKNRGGVKTDAIGFKGKNSGTINRKNEKLKG